MPRADWDGRISGAPLAPPSLATEGFVHCSFAYQLGGTLRKHFQATDQLVLLRLQSSLLTDTLKIENTYGGARLFPHLYTAIPEESIVDTMPIDQPHAFRFPRAWVDKGEFSLRRISSDDDPAVAALIRSVMTEYGASGPGFSINDPEVDHMHSAYAGIRGQFLVIETNGELLGCGGFGPLTGADPDTSELKKMYFAPDLRGFGLGSDLVRLCEHEAAALGYRRMYVETFHTMTEALALYRGMGYRELPGPLGMTGHNRCDHFLVKDLVR